MKLAAMMLVEPWSIDIKKMMDMVLGSGGAVSEKVGMGWGFAVGRDKGRGGGECHI